jgi:PDDEXK-like domain of unknown function (DUF3799)
MSKSYFDYDGLSYSQMKEILVSPAHYRYTMELRKTELPSDPLRIGSAYDALIFNREVEFAIWRDTKTVQSIAAEKFRIANPDLLVLTEEEHKRLVDMEKVLRQSPAWRFVEASQHQVEFYDQEDTDYGSIPVKAMVDGISDRFIWDLKTTGSLATEFPYNARKFRYGMQAAWYRHRAVMKDDKLRDFYFVVQESKPPYGVKVWKASDETLGAGYDDAMKACAIYAKCRAENSWPSYDASVIEVF